MPAWAVAGDARAIAEFRFERLGNSEIRISVGRYEVHGIPMLPPMLSASAERPLPELLLESLRRMAAAGHQPGRYVVLRLTDGRVRAYALMDERRSPFEIIGEIRNESGPLSSAFLVGSTRGHHGLTIFVEDLLIRQRLETTPECNSRGSALMPYMPRPARRELGPA